MAKEAAMTDNAQIVERLRKWKPGDKQGWCNEAATHIETLTRQLDEAREALRRIRDSDYSANIYDPWAEARAAYKTLGGSHEA